MRKVHNGDCQESSWLVEMNVSKLSKMVSEPSGVNYLALDICVCYNTKESTGSG